VAYLLSKLIQDDESGGMGRSLYLIKKIITKAPIINLSDVTPRSNAVIKIGVK